MARRTQIIVAGLPRSGTSWLARGLAFAKGLTYYREPDNHDHVAGASPRFPFLYLPDGADDAEYRAHMQRAMTGQVATRFTLSQDPGPVFERLDQRVWWIGERLPALFFRSQLGLVKLVNSNLALDFLAEHFPEARQVYIVRHPCGQFASWKRQGWQPRPEKLLDDPRLVADHLAPYTEAIRKATGFWERAGVWWGAVNTVVSRQSEKRPERLVVTFEWLCADPLTHFRTLYARLGVAWNQDVEDFLRKSNREGKNRTYSLIRNAAHEATKWKEELDPRDIETCRRAVEPFGLPFYPGFEPVAESPRWS